MKRPRRDSRMIIYLVILVICLFTCVPYVESDEDITQFLLVILPAMFSTTYPANT